MKREIFALSMVLAAATTYAQGALDVLNRAQQSGSNWYGNTMDNAHRRTQMDQINQEQAWFNRCMYQTGGDAARCGGIRQAQMPPPRPQQPDPEPPGFAARLVGEGGQAQSVTGMWATKCIYEVNGQQFVKLYARCPTTVYVR
jgi:hypothetical protein